jgi:hypothetical protein
MREDKQKILDLLLPAVKATRDQHDLQALNYDAEKEIVAVVYENGVLNVNVACDSGIAMILDVLRAIS